MTEPKTKGVLTGVAGEYFVAAELTIRGFIASITLKNTKGLDILVSNKDASKSIGIQVKTNNDNRRRAWLLNKKAEDYYKDNLFYVFVNLNDTDTEKRPDYYIVPSKIVSDSIKSDYEDWIKTPGKGGQPHDPDSPMRMFRDLDGKYLGKWKLIEKILETSSPTS